MMIVIKFILYMCVALVALVDLVLLIKLIEYGWCVLIRHQAPFVPSNRYLRAAVVHELKTYYPHARRILEIGSGYGGLTRYITRHTGAMAVGVENMPMSAFLSTMADWTCPGARTVWADAFQYMKSGEKFDIAMAYLGPKLTPRLADFRSCFDVLILMDFQLHGVRPVRVVDLNCGCVRYGGKKYPHRLYIYEF